MQKGCTITGIRNLQNESNRQKGYKVKRRNKVKHHLKVAPFIKYYRSIGYKYTDIALKLNMLGFRTIRGALYNKVSVGRLWIYWNY